MRRHFLVWTTGVALASTGIALALSVLSPWGMLLEERALDLVVGIAHRKAETEIVIVSADGPVSRADLAKEVTALLDAHAVAVGVLIPVTNLASASASDDDELALALRRSHKVALSVRLQPSGPVLPPARLAAELPLGFREVDRPRRGSLRRRLRADFGDIPLQSMAVATLLCIQGRPQAQFDPDTIGRLPFDQPAKTRAFGMGKWRPVSIAGRAVLLAPQASEAEPTAAALQALLLAYPGARIELRDGLHTFAMCLLGAWVSVLWGVPIIFVFLPLLIGLAVGTALWAGVSGFPLLLVAPLSGLTLTVLVLSARRWMLGVMDRRRICALLLPRTSRELAIDLAAAPRSLEPARRNLCILVALLDSKGASDDPKQLALGLESHERRVLEATRRFGGIVDRFEGSQVVALFGIAGPTDPMATRQRAAVLAVRTACEIIQYSRDIAIGLDLGEVLCGIYGADAHLRAHGEVIERAILAAQAAASSGGRVLATQAVLDEVHGQFAGERQDQLEIPLALYRLACGG